MTTLQTRIAIVLDRSSSMGSIRKEAVQMFNDQVAAIKKNGMDQDTRVSLFTFGTIADEPTIFNAPASEMLDLSEGEYSPNGWTAMYDGIGMTIDRLSALKEATNKDCSFLVVVITDGEENRSTKYNAFTIGDRIKLLQSTGKWTFTFMGANIDVEKMGTTLHIPKGNTMSWQASCIGANLASAQTSAATSNYLYTRSATGTGSVQNFYNGQQTATQTTTNPIETNQANQEGKYKGDNK